MAYRFGLRAPHLSRQCSVHPGLDEEDEDEEEAWSEVRLLEATQPACRQVNEDEAGTAAACARGDVAAAAARAMAKSCIVW